MEAVLARDNNCSGLFDDSRLLRAKQLCYKGIGVRSDIQLLFLNHQVCSFDPFVLFENYTKSLSERNEGVQKI